MNGVATRAAFPPDIGNFDTADASHSILGKYMDRVDYRRLFDSLPAPYMLVDRNLNIIGANAVYLATVRRNAEDIIGKNAFEAFPGDAERVDVFRNSVQEAMTGKPTNLVRELFSIPDADSPGGLRDVWWTCHHVPLYGKHGDIVGVAQSALDVTSEVRAERRSSRISRELHHRVRNQLASIMAIAHRTARNSASLGQFNGSFQARLESLGRTHQLLADADGRGALLGDLVRNELSPFLLESELDRQIRGPEVRLTASQLQPLGMALHELASNAAKYGALRGEFGTLSIRWERDGSQVTLHWEEKDVPDMPTDEPIRGFGTDIVEKLLPAELGGTVRREFLSTGLLCTITFAIPHHVA